MSVLETLSFSDVSKKSEKTTPHINLRQRLIAAIDEQIMAVNSELNNEHYVRTVQKNVVNEHTGGKEVTEVHRILRKMWWKSSAGILLELRFANRPMKIAGRSSIIVGELSNLIPTFEKIRQAVDAGELDAVMAEISESRKRSKKANIIPASDGKPAKASK